MEEIVKELLKPSNTLDFLSSSDSCEDTSTDDSDVDRVKRTRIEDFTEKVIPSYLNFEFKNHFRMSRESFQKLCEIISSNKTNIGGWPSITKEKGVLMMLWYLANQESFRQLCDRFGVTESACYSTISSMIEFLVDHRNEYVKLPARENYNTIAAEFKKKKDIPYVIGAIDGSHISINKPRLNDVDYVNRKGFHSILLQGVVNHKKMFIDAFCGEPGSLHDARLLRKSGLYKRASDNSELFGKYFLLGDSAYPASVNWIVPPFKDNGFLTPNQKDFNYRHSATRMIVENAFALLKGRFRRLKHFENRKIDFIIKCVIAAIVLHNLCLMWNDEAKDFITSDNEVVGNIEQEHDEHNEVLQGLTRRDELFNALYQ